MQMQGLNSSGTQAKFGQSERISQEAEYMSRRPKPWKGACVFLATVLLSITTSAQMSVQTVGGISYFIHTTAMMPICEWTESSPVTRSGTHLVLTVYHRQADFCIFCVDNCYYRETYTAVLGSLPPGVYTLTVFFANPFPSGPLSVFMSFEVPVPESQPITATRTPTGLHLDVVGVSSATYIVEASSDLINWTGIHTNTGAPFFLDVPRSGMTEHQFYRVRVLSGRK